MKDDNFHKRSSYSRERLGSRQIYKGKNPEPFKSYPGSKTVALPRPELPSGSLWKALKNRRSRRDFNRKPLSSEELSLLIWACQGVTDRVAGYLLRTAPSAGALYPIEMYLVVNRVEDLNSGIYHWEIRNEVLEVLREGDFSSKIADACLSQDMCESCAVVFCFSAVFGRTLRKYGERGFRYVYMDSAHIVANLYLACEDLGLGCCGIGAFLDDEVNELLGLDGEEESAVYLSAVGRY